MREESEVVGLEGVGGCGRAEGFESCSRVHDRGLDYPAHLKFTLTV
jgi:hypothetical protein